LIYLDSNIFISAALYDNLSGKNARQIIKDVRCGDIRASTSTLTFDEVYWIVKKEKGKEPALKIAKALLHMKNLDLIAVDREILYSSYDLLEETCLDPRDSIHLACALKSRSGLMLSEDSDFDDIEIMENMTMERYLKQRDHNRN